jgi:hypothetical protein
MKVHTHLSREAMQLAIRHLPNGVFFHTLEQHGSKTHPRSFRFLLYGNGGLNNTGRYGAGDYSGATWDEWGAVIGAIFQMDANARFGGTEARPEYIDKEHFDFVTGNRFTTGEIPSDTHPRHRWVQDDNGYTGSDRWSKAPWHCSKCSARRPSNFEDLQYRNERHYAAAA